MPLFEYRCGSCQAQSELLILAGDVATTPACPSCGSYAMQRLLSTFATHSSSSKPAAACDMDGGCGSGACGSPEMCGAGAGFGGGFGGDTDF